MISERDIRNLTDGEYIHAYYGKYESYVILLDFPKLYIMEVNRQNELMDVTEILAPKQLENFQDIIPTPTEITPSPTFGWKVKKDSAWFTVKLHLETLVIDTKEDPNPIEREVVEEVLVKSKVKEGNKLHVIGTVEEDTTVFQVYNLSTQETEVRYTLAHESGDVVLYHITLNPERDFVYVMGCIKYPNKKTVPFMEQFQTR